MNLLDRLIAARRVGDVAPPPPPPPPSSALQLLLARTGQTIADLRAEEGNESDHYTEETKIDAVPLTRELERIRDLPRRSIDSGDQLVAKLTDALRTPWGTQTLRPIQALALWEIATVGGLFGPIRVGAGKTLISYLAPTILNSKRPLLIIPASLKEKTRREFGTLAQHWMGFDPRAYRIESYNALGRTEAGSKLDAKGKQIEKGLLEKYNPDVIILDEAHRVKNKKAAVTRRIRRYLEAHPNVVVIALSGTMIRKSLKDCAHTAEWCLPKLTPIPKTHGDLDAWAGALDKIAVDGHRVRAGALVELCTPEEREAIERSERDGYGMSDDAIKAVRNAFRRRLVETPGVIATQEGPMDMSLTLTAHLPKKLDPEMEKHFAHLRATYETPTGIPISDGITFKRHALEMALGFEYLWDPAAPPEWLAVRRAWSAVCRQILKNNRRGLDSEKQVTTAVRQGIYPGLEILREWEKVEPTFDPNTVPVWFSQEALETAAAWASDNGGVVWVDHRAFAVALSKITKLPYYGRDGLAANGDYIEKHPAGRPCIASIKSNSVGRNLQYQWASGLVMTPPSSGLTWEQLIGRKHREGQEADEVSFDVYLACAENLIDFYTSLEEARMEEQTQGQAQKLSYATKALPTVEELASRGGARWGR